MMPPRSLLLSFMKPIRFKLLGGNFKVRTHPRMQVDVLPYKMEKSLSLIPQIKEYNDYIEISGQNFAKLVRQDEKVDLDVFLPEKCDFDFNMKAGVLEIDGIFSRYDANILAGEIKVTPNPETKKGNVSVGVGSLVFYAPSSDKIIYKKNTFLTKEFTHNDTSEYSLKAKIIGGVDIKEKRR